MRGWPFRLLLVACGVGLFALAVVVLHGPLIAAGVASAARIAGYNVRYDGLRFTAGHVIITHPDISSLDGEPVFTAQSVDIAYDSRTLFRGPHFYGISGIDLERPKLTIVHHRDGTYNVHLPASNPRAKSRPFVFPQIVVAIHNGSIGLIDRTRIFRHSRSFALQNIQGSAVVDPHARSNFTVDSTLVEDGGAFPIVARGRFDPARGYELSRVTARTLAFAPLLDYALNSTSLHIANGVLHNVDAVVYGLRDRAGTIERHVSASATIDHFQPYLNSLAKPLRDGRGSIGVYDGGIAIPQVSGTIAGVPVRIAGGIYDLAHPTLRLGITGRGELTQLLTLSHSAKNLPLRGPIAFKLFVEGAATAPQTLASFSSNHVSYDRIPIDDPSGLVALDGPETAIVRGSLRYDGIDLTTRGRVLSVGKHANIELVASAAAPASRFPYASALVPAMSLSAIGVAAGVDSNLALTGTIDGATQARRLAGTFALDGRGVGTIGPLAITGPGSRSFDAYVGFDRPGFRSGAAFVSASRFAFSTRGPQASFPGLTLAPLPPADGTLDATLATAFEGSRFVLGGDARLRNAHILGYPVEDLQLRARASDGQRLAIDARYRGSLAALAGVAGAGVAISGRADVPFSAIASGSSDALVSIDGARFTNASIAGIALQGLSATIGIRGRAVDVYAARATLDGNDVVAHGSFGDGGTVAVSARDVDLAALRGLGLPVRAGRVTAVADVGGTSAEPQIDGGIALANVPIPNALLRGHDVDANAALTYAGDTLRVRDGLARTGTTVASLDGDVRGLRANARSASYALDARVHQADLTDIAHLAHVPLRYPEGSLDANVRIAGRGASPAITGDIVIPEGSINGLRFRDARVALVGTPAAFHADAGRVTVGSSVLDFDAAIARGAGTLSLSSPRVDLTDFNDYFDRGDTLGGRGRFAVSVRDDARSLATDGDVAIARARYRSFDLGDARARWSTNGRVVTLASSLGGTAGELTTAGTLELAATAPLRDALRRTTVSLTTRARGVDLGTWLPVVGVVAPIFGHVDADAHIGGAYPDIAIAGNASVRDGLIGRVPVRTATVALRGTRGRITIASAVLGIDNLHIEAAGSLGLRPNDPVDLRLTAQTADTGALAKTLTGHVFDTSGGVATTLDVGGTLARPLATDHLDATALRYAGYTLPAAHFVAALEARRLTLTRGEMDFRDGSLSATGFVPIERGRGIGGAIAIGPASAPLEFDLAANAIGLAQFASLFPKGTAASGTLAGRFGVGGSIAAPALDGTLALANGSFVGPQLRSKLDDLTAQLSFGGSTASLHDARATVGGGTIAAYGTASLPSLRAPGRDLSYALHLTSTNAFLDAPQYLRGRVDGTVALTRTPGLPPLLAGDVALHQTRVPLSAIFNPSAPQTTATPSPLALALHLGVDVGQDVRVQGGPVDIGARGHIVVGGSLAAPTASGELDSTGGTIGFYRTFRLQDPSTVVFDPGDGVIPTVDATATTTVDNPQTDVTLHVTGLATQLNVALASDPNYSRAQILGLLVGAQALGAVSGLQQSGSTGNAPNPFTALAEGQLGTLLTQNILEPLSSQIGSAIGLNNLAINYSVGGSFDIGAQKKIFKNVNLVFADSFNYPPRQSIGVRASPNDATAIQLTFFSQPTSNKFDIFSADRALQSTNQSVTSTEPATGTTGFSLSFQRRFR